MSESFTEDTGTRYPDSTQKTHDLSLVITFLSKLGIELFLDVMTNLHMLLFLLLIITFAEIFCNDCVHSAKLQVQLI